MSVLCLSVVAGISSTALAATPNDCAGGYALAVATANTALNEALQACNAESGCVEMAAAAHRAAVEEAQANFQACLATAVPPTP